MASIPESHLYALVTGLLECAICRTLWLFTRRANDVETIETAHCRGCGASLDLLETSLCTAAVLNLPPTSLPCRSDASTMINKQAAIERLLEHEGGWSDRADDPGNANGGATNWGWTLTQFRKVTCNPGATKEDLRALTREAAGELHWQEFVVETRIGGIPNAALAEAVFDAAVNSGPRNAIKMLQRALGFTGADVDGVLGTVTMHSIPTDGLKLARIFLAERMEFLGRWAAGDLTDADKDGIPDRLENLKGVLNRVGKQMRSVA